MGSITVLYAIWAFVILSIGNADSIVANDGSLLFQLKDRLRPVAYMAGVFFVIMTLGIGVANYALGLRILIIELIEKARMTFGKITKFSSESTPQPRVLDHWSAILPTAAIAGAMAFAAYGFFKN